MTRIVIPGGIVLAVILLLLAATWKSLIPPMEVSAVPVVERPGGSSRPQSDAVVMASGWIEADPHLVYVSALTSGVVEEILVLEGDTVTQNQVVARLVGEDARLALRRAEAEVVNRQAMVTEAQAQLNAMQTNWDNPVEVNRGAEVAEAALVESHSQLGELEAHIVGAESNAERLRLDHERFVPLRENNTISESEYLEAKTAWETQEASLEALRRRREVLNAQIQRHQAELRAATENLRLRTDERQALETAQAALERAEAALQSAEVTRDEAALRVERLEIRSPMNGVVVERFTEPGAQVMIGGDNRLMSAIVSLYEPANLQVRVDVPLADAAALHVNQMAEITVDALPDTVFQGIVTRVLHQADIQKNTIQIKVAVQDPSPLLRPEMLSRVRLFGGSMEPGIPTESAGLFAPAGSLDGQRIWCVEEYDGTHGIAQPREVTVIGSAQQGWIEITSGLRPGDLVLMPVPTDLSAGQRVAVTQSTI